LSNSLFEIAAACNSKLKTYNSKLLNSYTLNFLSVDNVFEIVWVDEGCWAEAIVFCEHL